MYRVKIYGAGSVGNHLAHAARSMGWEVTVCDISDEALTRMKDEIYPTRYGKWDPEIQLFNNYDAEQGSFDMIFIGSPPDHHLDLALEVLGEGPGLVLVEKPFCSPNLLKADDIYRVAKDSSVQMFVGYNHVVGIAMRKVEELIAEGAIGDANTIDVEFREHWAGIFAAHPWLKGPEDTYLGYWEKGGGASGEHSHAINLWQHLAHRVGAGRVVEVSGMLNYVTEGKAQYDDLCFLNLRTENGLMGRVVQDVVTLPPRKRALIEGRKGSIEWVCNYEAEVDAVILRKPDGTEQIYRIEKTRSDDFLEELKVLRDQMSDPVLDSGIQLDRGLDTMLVIAAAHRSAQEKRCMRVDYSQGYNQEAIIPCLPH